MQVVKKRKQPKKAKAKAPAKRTKAGSERRAVKPDKITEETPLLATEQRFCDEYLKDLNQTQAAIRAGFAPSAAARLACLMKKKVNVAAYIARKLADQSTRTGLEFDRIMREAARIAFADPTKVMDPRTGAVRTFGEDEAAAISGIKFKPGEFGDEREIKFHSKEKALDIILKYSKAGLEFEAKMAIEREKLAIQREQLEIEKRRLAIQEAQAAQEKDGFNKVISIIDPFGEQHQPMPKGQNVAEVPDGDNESTNAGGEPA